MLECGSSATGPNAAFPNLLTREGLNAMKMQATVTHWFSFLGLCMSELWSCFLTLQNSEQSARFHRLLAGKGAHCFPWVPVLYTTRGPRFLWIFVILPTLYQTLSEVTHFSCSGFMNRRRRELLCWIPAVVSIRQSLPGLELSL